jgi:hypothetical protein
MGAEIYSTENVPGERKYMHLHRILAGHKRCARIVT